MLINTIKKINQSNNVTWIKYQPYILKCSNQKRIWNSIRNHWKFKCFILDGTTAI